MSFVKDNPSFFECNCCGDRRYLQRDFHSTWSELKAEGWKAYKDVDGFIHDCSECAAEAAAKRGSNLDRLRSVK
jgi:hypothetical protein